LRVVNKQFLGKRLGTYPAYATKMLGCSPQVQNTRGAVFYPIPKTLEILHLIPSWSTDFLFLCSSRCPQRRFMRNPASNRVAKVMKEYGCFHWQ